MFQISIRMQQGSNFSSELYMNNKNIGGLGKDKEGFYVNLNQRLDVGQMIELMSFINVSSKNAHLEELKIQYTEDYSDKQGKI